MILQREPFVAKLYAAFQSKTNLYLVMRYIDGGDCAALDKPLDAKGYTGDVVLAIAAQQVCRIMMLGTRYRFYQQFWSWSFRYEVCILLTVIGCIQCARSELG